MKPLLLVLLTTILAACTGLAQVATPTPYPTSTSYPTSTPYPTPTMAFDEAFLRELQNRIQVDDTIPAIGKKALIALAVKDPTYVFKHNQGIVVQFNIPSVPEEPELKKTAVLLIGTAVVVAGEQKLPLTGIEVVFHLKKWEPWLALALMPPWDVEGDLRLAPLHPDYIKKLQEAGVITPTPEPTY